MESDLSIKTMVKRYSEIGNKDKETVPHLHNSHVA